METDKRGALLLAFYGDFSGSTGALEVLSRFQIKTVHFILPPDAKQLEAFSGIRAFGMEGMSRSISPDERASS